MGRLLGDKLLLLETQLRVVREDALSCGASSGIVTELEEAMTSVGKARAELQRDRRGEWPAEPDTPSMRPDDADQGAPDAP